MPIGLYVHIPYCQHKCGYCDFNSHAGSNRAEQARYVDALLREMELWAARPEVAGEQVSTVFVGGGTPTLLEGGAVGPGAARDAAALPPGPRRRGDDRGQPRHGGCGGGEAPPAFEAGANRLSLGVQARQRHLLERLGRIHDALQVEAAVEAARRAGFTNINLDLMYGLPGQTPADFRETVAWALGLGPTHISAYSLIWRKGRPSTSPIRPARLHLPPEEAEEQMFREGKALLEAAGFEHYEVSNCARPGIRCRHNLIYWRNEHYLGLGCGAHSFLRLAAPLENLGPPVPASRHPAFRAAARWRRRPAGRGSSTASGT